MKNSFLFLAFLAFTFQAFAQSNADSRTQGVDDIAAIETTETKTDAVISKVEAVQENTSQLTVAINGLDSDKGTIMVGIYDSKGSWLSKVRFSEKSIIVDGTATVVFENVPAGTYAISTYHDENDNEKLDSGIFGIPKEPYAASRGAKGRFGPPKWKDAKFEVIAAAHIEEIKY